MGKFKRRVQCAVCYEYPRRGEWHKNGKTYICWECNDRISTE